MFNHGILIRGLICPTQEVICIMLCRGVHRVTTGHRHFRLGVSTDHHRQEDLLQMHVAILTHEYSFLWLYAYAKDQVSIFALIHNII
jgi:hypothetical protein